MPLRLVLFVIFNSLQEAQARPKREKPTLSKNSHSIKGIGVVFIHYYS